MRCLIVCNNLPTRERIEKLIKKIGGVNSINLARNVQSATAELSKFSFDLAVLDISAPKEASINLIKWMRSERLNIGIILISSENSVEYIKEALGYGVCDFVIKPFSYTRFKEAMTMAMGKRAYLDEFKYMSQNEIDHFIALNSHQKAGELTGNKGISIETFKRIEEAISHEDGPFTAKSLAVKAGLSRITVRRYLEHMVESDILSADLQYGEVGRPQKVYKKNE